MNVNAKTFNLFVWILVCLFNVFAFAGEDPQLKLIKYQECPEWAKKPSIRDWYNAVPWHQFSNEERKKAIDNLHKKPELRVNLM